MPESQNIEWKSKWKDDYLEWICGYANAQGGKIYIGRDDDGKIIGINNAHKLLEDIPNKIRDAMGIIVGVNLYEEDGKEYIEIDVPAYPIGISCKGVYYYRSGSTRQILTGPALETFLMRKRGATWDNLPLPAFSLNEIDDAVVERFKKWASKKGRIDKSVLDEPKDVLMEKLHLTNGSYLTNAAMLLFSKDPEKWQLGAYVKIGFFETDADLLYQDEVHGSLLDQIDKTVELVYLKYMKAKITYEGMQRIERYFVPEEALREAILNALCHKQYESGIPIQISVYNDKLYIANCGCLPENWTLDNLMQKHASKPYNPNIAHVFYLAGFIESWGRGIEKIFSACKNDGVPQPVYTINPGDIMIEFIAPEDRIIRYPKVIDGVTKPETGGVTKPGTKPKSNGGTKLGTKPETGRMGKPENKPGSGEGTKPEPKPESDGGTKLGTKPETGRVAKPETKPGSGEGTKPETKPGTDEVVDDERVLLMFLAEDPGYTTRQLSEKMKINRKVVIQIIKQLKEKGYIERIGSNRKGYWKTKDQ